MSYWNCDICSNFINDLENSVTRKEETPNDWRKNHFIRFYN